MPLRFGVLGASFIAPSALIDPAGENAEATIGAIAARDPEKAKAFAAAHGIEKVHQSYEDLIADPDIDAIYNALPNGLHGRWTLAAIKAGKHVLCEKPFSANAEEAEAVAAAARRSGLVVTEAFQYRYHPFVERAFEIAASGELGEVRRIEAWFWLRFVPADNIRLDLRLAGGALMDPGCYTVHALRTFAGCEPAVRSVETKVSEPGLEHFARADFEFPDGKTGGIAVSHSSPNPTTCGVRLIGERAALEIDNPFLVYQSNGLEVRSADGVRREDIAKHPTSYAFQLKAFVGAVFRGEPFPTNVADSVANMRVIDACYAAAGLPRREPSMR